MILFYLLQQLKTRLQARFLDQVLSYTCHVEGVVKQHDKEMVSSIKCRLLITFANSLGPEQAWENVGPDLDPNCLTI